MACLPDLMTQETAFLGMLRDVRHFDVRPDGTLELKTADGRTIVARRPWGCRQLLMRAPEAWSKKCSASFLKPIATP